MAPTTFSNSVLAYHRSKTTNDTRSDEELILYAGDTYPDLSEQYPDFKRDYQTLVKLRALRYRPDPVLVNPIGIWLILASIGFAGAFILVPMAWTGVLNRIREIAEAFRGPSAPHN